MPPKGSKKLIEKQKQIGMLASKKKHVSSMQTTLSDLDKQINTLEHRLKRKKDRIAALEQSINV